MTSPYKGIKPNKWLETTKKLVASHPLSKDELKSLVLSSWEDIFDSQIGKKPYYIGKDIFPKPQIIGFLLHELIQVKIEAKYPKIWRKEKAAKDKDLVYISDEKFSFEIKTSSNPQSIFGNRSYAQKAKSEGKGKSGYYLAVNFEKCTHNLAKPKILKIRFGWLDHEDWLGQKAATGQQSRLSRNVEDGKLLLIYSAK